MNASTRSGGSSAPGGGSATSRWTSRSTCLRPARRRGTVRPPHREGGRSCARRRLDRDRRRRGSEFNRSAGGGRRLRSAAPSASSGGARRRHVARPALGRALQPKRTVETMLPTIVVHVDTNRLDLYEGFRVTHSWDVATAKPGWVTPVGEWTLYRSGRTRPGTTRRSTAGAPACRPWCRAGLATRWARGRCTSRPRADPDPRHDDAVLDRHATRRTAASGCTTRRSRSSTRWCRSARR